MVAVVMETQKMVEVKVNKVDSRMQRYFSHSFCLVLLIATACVSCDNRKIACYSYTSVSVNDWERSDEVTINVDTIRETSDYNAKIGLRSTLEFPFRYLWLRVKIDMENPAFSSVDTLKCAITDSKGNKNGGGFSLFEEQFNLKKLKLEKGQYGKVSIRHIMRRTPLPGVSDVGLILEKAD